MKRETQKIVPRAIRLGIDPRLAAAGVALTVVFTSTQAAVPLIVGQIIDKTLRQGDARTLLRWCIVLALVSVCLHVSREGADVTFGHLRQLLLVRLRERLLDRLQRAPLARLERGTSGELAALFMTDAPRVADVFHPFLHQLLVSTLQLALVISIVAWRYGATVLVVLLLVPVYLSVPVLFTRPTRAAARRATEAEAQVHASVDQSIDLVREIKALNRHEWNRERAGGVFRASQKRQLRLQVFTALFTLGSAAYAVTAAFLYWYGGNQVIDGRITVGELVALVWFLGLLANPTNMLNGLQGRLQVVTASGHRIFDFLDLPAESRRGSPAAEPLDRATALELRDVSFRYPGSDAPALDRVSFRIARGERVAVVGPSGAGKSTLLALLLRFYDAGSGEILIHGRPIESYDLESLRREVGLVPQEPRLFSVSVRDNIRLGDLDASGDDLLEAARVANAEEFISRLPGGLDMEVGEDGVRLSVGQKQRIAIARVVLRNPSILVLDEATSALDSESELLVRDAIRHAMDGRTTLMAAHRLNTVLDCDRILVLDGGRLVAEGGHDELLETDPLYRRLVTLHFGTADPRPAAELPSKEHST